MSSRRDFLRRTGAAAATVSLAATAGCLGGGFVRTKAGGGSTEPINLSSPNADDKFVPPNQFTAYVNRMRETYGEAAIPWSEPRSLAGTFVGTYARQVEIIPDHQFAVQDAAIFVHHLGDTRYRLRLWSAGRLFEKQYEVDPWGYYEEEPAFTWLEQGIEVEYDDHLSTSQSLSTDGGRIDVAGGIVTVPDGSYEMGLEDDVRYRSHWEDFYPGIVPLVGACEVSFAHADERRFTWNLSNGVGIRTPF